MTIDVPPSHRLYRMAEVAGIIGKSLRWLQYHCKANPCGRMAGRTRLFTDADLSKLILAAEGSWTIGLQSTQSASAGSGLDCLGAASQGAQSQAPKAQATG